MPAVIFWLTTDPDALAEPEMIEEGEASVPLYTAAVHVCVDIVSPEASLLAKSNWYRRSSEASFEGRLTRLSNQLAFTSILALRK